MPDLLIGNSSSQQHPVSQNVIFKHTELSKESKFMFHYSGDSCTKMSNTFPCQFCDKDKDRIEFKHLISKCNRD